MNSALFYRELGSLLKAGIPATLAIDKIAQQSGASGKQGQKLLAALNGRTLAQAFARAGGIAEPLELTLIEIGETAGRLDTVLLSLADDRDRRSQMQKKLLSELLYPVIVLHLAVAVSALLTCVADHFNYSRFPWEFLKLIGPWYVLVLCIHLLYRESSQVRAVVESLLHPVPLIGPLIRSTVRSRFLHAFHLLHSAGVSIDKTLELSAAISGSSTVRRQVDEGSRLLAQGGNFGTFIKSLRFLDPSHTLLLSTAFTGGSLETGLLHVCTFVDFDIEMQRKRLTVVVPVIIILILAFIVTNQIYGFYLQAYAELGI